MELVNKDEKNLVYVDEKDGATYTMVDMSDYIGHKSRDVFDAVSPNYRLMFYDIGEGDQKIHM